jgi:hypothetical protein
MRYPSASSLILGLGRTQVLAPRMKAFERASSLSKQPRTGFQIVSKCPEEILAAVEVYITETGCEKGRLMLQELYETWDPECFSKEHKCRETYYMSPKPDEIKAVSI